jgi:hypothetical protein
MVFAPLVVFGFSTKPPTMIRLFAELAGHYPPHASCPGRWLLDVRCWMLENRAGRGAIFLLDQLPGDPHVPGFVP